MANGPLNQIIFADPNLLETPEAGFVNIMIDVDKTIWGRLPDGTLHQFSANSPLNIVGTLNPGGGNINYPAADAGDIYIFISAGTIGAPPVEVEQGEMLLCVTDSAGGAGAGADFTIYQINIQYATTVVAGIILITTNAKMETNVDDEAAVTSAKLYYLLQTFGLDFIKSDGMISKNITGTSQLEVRTIANSNPVGPNNPIAIYTQGGVTNVGAGNTADAGYIEITGGSSGNVVDGTAGLSGGIYITSGNGGAASGTGTGGDSDAIQISVGLGGDAVETPGNGGRVSVNAGWGGQSTNANGGNGGEALITSGPGGSTPAAAQLGGNAGMINLTAGSGGQAIGAGGGGGNGGGIRIDAGDSGRGQDFAGIPGDLALVAGNAGQMDAGSNGNQQAGGNVFISAGRGNLTGNGEFPGSGGGVFITGGQGVEQTANGGAGSAPGNGGAIRITGGAADDGILDSAISGAGGGVQITAGASGTNSQAAGTGYIGAAILITASQGGAASGVGSTGGNGGDVQLTPGTAGIGTAANGNPGNLVLAGVPVFSSVVDNVVAFGGGGGAGATLLTGCIARVATVAAGGDSVKLPKTKGTIGEMFKVRNDGANAMDLFPNNLAHTINGAASISIPATESRTIHRLTATELYVFD